jgi:hypothetical protein
MITLPVSLGEALDKLTILEIKCKRIRNHDASKKEYDILKEQLQPYLETFAFQYRLLYTVNDEIWVMQDEIREMSVPSGEKCIDILNKNDMRFRIKDTVNKLSQSFLREQKGYSPRKALFIGHMGLGDHIGLNGAVRFVALQHDETHVVVKRNNVDAVTAMFADDPSIKLIVVESGYIQSPTETTRGEALLYTPSEYLNVYRSGFYKENHEPMSELPHCFYRDMKMDPSIRHIYFNVPRSPAATALYEPLRDRSYKFTQQQSSGQFTPLITWDKDLILTIDPNKNSYTPDHEWYGLANSFVNRPFFDYVLVIENAEEIHTVDSSFYCLASYLKLRASVRNCYSRDTATLIPSYTFN